MRQMEWNTAAMHAIRATIADIAAGSAQEQADRIRPRGFGRSTEEERDAHQRAEDIAKGQRESAGRAARIAARAWINQARANGRASG